MTHEEQLLKKAYALMDKFYWLTWDLAMSGDQERYDRAAAVQDKVDKRYERRYNVYKSLNIPGSDI